MSNKFIIALLVLGFATQAVLPASALTFSPAIREYDRLPGEVITETLRLFNDGDTDKIFYPLFMDYTAPNDESGTPNFIPQGSIATSGSLALWFNKIEPVSIKAKGRQEIALQISIPADAEPGGHYGAVLFSDQPSTSDSIGVGAQTGPIFLVNILGDVKEDFSILDFKAEKKLLTSLPVGFSVRFENKGTVHETPKGEIRLQGWWPKNTIVPFNERSMSHVLPKSIRKMNATWGERSDSSTGFIAELKNEWRNLAFGKFQAELSIDYGVQKAGTVTSKTTFWLFPWHLGLVVLLGLSILAMLLRAYNRMVIRMAQKAKK